MATDRSRTAVRIPDGPPGVAAGVWATWLAVLVISLFLAGLVAAALYLHTGQPAWPPEGIVRPSRAWAAGSLVVGAVGAVAMQIGRRRMIADQRRSSVTWMVTSLGLQLAAIILLVQDLQAVPFGWEEHAYTSLYWVLTATAMVLVGVGVLMTVSVVIHTLTGVIDPPRSLELDTTTIMVGYAVAASLVLLALVHLLPSPGGSA